MVHNYIDTLRFDIKKYNKQIADLELNRSIEIEHTSFDEAKKTTARIISLKAKRDRAMNELFRVIDSALVTSPERFSDLMGNLRTAEDPIDAKTVQKENKD